MTKQWSDVFVDVKHLIINLLDYESRCNLRLCSKNDRYAVDGTKFKPKMFEIREMQSEMDAEKRILRLEVDTFTIWFVGKDNNAKIDRGWNGEVIWSELKKEHPYELAKKFIDKLTHDDVIESHTILISNSNLTPLPHWKFKCDNLQLMEVRHGADLLWLGQTEPKFKVLEVGVWAFSAINDYPQILGASDSLRLFSDTNVTDEVVRKVTATNIKIVSMSMTIDSVKFTLDRFLRLGKKSDVMDFELLSPDGFNALLHVIPEGVRVRKDKPRRENETPEMYCCKILDGFTNVHGVQDIRQLTCAPFGNVLSVTCQVWKKPTAVSTLYPFTLH